MVSQGFTRVVVVTMTGSYAEIYDKTGCLVRTESITADGQPTAEPTKPGARPAPQPVVRHVQSGKPGPEPATSNAPSTELIIY